MIDMTTARKALAGAGAGALALGLTTFAALPAAAESDDISVSKSANTASAYAGDTVDYTVEIRGAQLVDLENFNDNSDANVHIFDDVPDHVTVTHASIEFNEVSAGNAAHWVASAYAGGSGWDGPWVESNDDGVESTGQAQSGLLGLRLRDQTAAQPTLTRTITPPGKVRSMLLTFVTGGVGTNASDTGELEISFDGGATWPVVQPFDGTGDTWAVPVTGLAADSITLRVRTTSSGTFGVAQFLWVSGFNVLYAYDSSSNTYDLDLGDVLTPDGDIDVGFWDVSYAETVYLRYSAVIDSVIADETIADPTVPTVTTELVNTVTVTSDDDPVGEVRDFTLSLVRDPDFDVVLTSSAPVHVGDPLTITAEVSHSSSSDGFPLCGASLALDVPPYQPLTLLSGDDGDGCLEYSETWTFTRTYPGLTGTSGPLDISLVLSGDGPGGDAYTDVEPLEITVVLADSGPSDASDLLVTVAGLIASGGALLFVRRRREA